MTGRDERGSAATWPYNGSEFGRQGHTIVEVAVMLGLLSAVLASAAAVLIAQQRFYSRNADIASTRDAARLAAAVLTAELRSVNASGGDIYGIGPDSVALRSTTGLGVVCSVSGHSVALRRVTGTFGELETDSAFVFVENSLHTTIDDRLVVVRIRESRLGSAALCPDGLPADVSLGFDRDVPGASTGSPVRAFRPYVYKLYAGQGGKWWFGQRLRSGRMQPIAGPFAPPSKGGLRLEYQSQAGVPTDDPLQVAHVNIAMLAQGRLRYPWRGLKDAYSDSVSTAVTPRGL